MQRYSMRHHFYTTRHAQTLVAAWLRDVWQGRRALALPDAAAARAFPFASADVPFRVGAGAGAGAGGAEFWCRIVFSEHHTAAARGGGAHYDWTVFLNSAYVGAFVCPAKNWVWPLTESSNSNNNNDGDVHGDGHDAPAFARNFVLWGLIAAVDGRGVVYATRGGLRDARGARVCAVRDWWDVWAPAARDGRRRAGWYRRWYARLGRRERE